MKNRAGAKARPSSAAAGGKPFVIAAFIGCQALGNFVMNQIVAASIARAIPGSRLALIFRNDRPYKSFITLCNPFVTRAVPIEADPGHVFPLGWLDGRENVPGRPFDRSWYEDGYHNPNLVLTSSMLDIWGCHWPAPGFFVPDDLAPPLNRILETRGVSKDGWFVCLHMREAGYRWRPVSDSDRNVDPHDYLPMIRHIIDDLGGQVVRLGHPEMTPLPEMDGLIDLGRHANSFPEQAFAISRARFFIGTDTGPTQLAAAFRTPTASTNALGIDLWNDGDVVMLRKITDEADVPIPLEDLIEMAPILGNYRPYGISYHANQPQDLVRIADHMAAATEECGGWREPAEQPPYEPPGRVELPLEWNSISNRVKIDFWPLQS
jgi:putative glycosyltransferase (TIGR04372 family)